jgi:hypothetical protein
VSLSEFLDQSYRRAGGFSVRERGMKAVLSESQVWSKTKGIMAIITHGYGPNLVKTFD